MKLIFATHNYNKLSEIQSLLGNDITLLSLSDIACSVEIPETADTIEGNSLLKAQYIWNRYAVSCFADDTGLEITALDGKPGVYSARYAGEPKNDNKNITKVLNELALLDERSARFKTVITLVLEGDYFQFTGIVEGNIGNAKKGENGFGYDPIFYPEQEKRTFAEMDIEEKNQFSHRARAFHQLVDFLQKNV